MTKHLSNTTVVHSVDGLVDVEQALSESVSFHSTDSRDIE